jgi:hypothetical protein
MKSSSTSAGRVLSASIEGGAATVRDIMVAGHIYLSALEERFNSLQHLLMCYQAWQQHDALRPGDMDDEQLDRVKQWLHAHTHADGIARQWLSDPDSQFFRLRMTAN